MEGDGHLLDLPLSANIKDILVEHFILEWNSLEQINTVSLFLVQADRNIAGQCREVVDSDSQDRSFQEQCDSGTEKIFEFILDCSNLDIISVAEILAPANLVYPKTNIKQTADIGNINGVYMKHLQFDSRALHFDVGKHHINIRKSGVTNVSDFPKIVRIRYKTLDDGKSFKWTCNQDNKRCGFTSGHWINNRSLFPSQDAPTAMSTWQALISVPFQSVVVMTGDRNGHLCDTNEEFKVYFFYSTVPMPTSTLALAAGQWLEIKIDADDSADDKPKLSACLQHGEDCRINFSALDVLPFRLFLSESLHMKSEELLYYFPRCMKAVKETLGVHPFQRLDVLVVPACFDSLGMASPNVLFLSQTVLVGDYSMCPRISHELCHSWFGLLIGPKDWTEEWLTEGFCTYLEDIVHSEAMEWDTSKSEEFINLRALLRHRTLLNEVKHTAQDLQSLRANQSSSAAADDKFVKNGMNPEKGFMQVHYLKGYFLLRHLEEAVGRKQFLNFLRNYVIKFHGELVSSKDFLDLFLKTFPDLSKTGISVESICEEWLDGSELPKSVINFADNINTKSINLIQTVYKEVEKINTVCHKYLKKSPKRRRSNESIIMSERIELTIDQKVFLLELLLDREKLPQTIFEDVKRLYSITNDNPEIYHRSCELIVKHKYKQFFSEVEQFLIKHQAMGVYLYGEMMISGDKNLIQLSRKCFSVLETEMPEGVAKTVHSMLYGQ